MHLPEIRLLQAAVALADELNFKRAADRLHIVQPTLSKQIIELEHELGCRLFTRNNQGVVLTESGKFFVQQAREALFHCQKAVQLSQAAAQGAGAFLSVGKSPYTDPFLVAALKSLVLPLYPDLQLNFSSMLSVELEQNVSEGKLDLAIVTAPSENARLTRVEIAIAPFYVLISANNALATNEQLCLKDLDRHRWILFERFVNPLAYERIMKAAAEESVRPISIEHVMSAEEAAQALEDEDRVAFLTRAGAWRVARNGLTMRPLIDEKLMLITALVVRADNESRLLSEVIRAFKRKLPSNKSNQLNLRLAG